MGVAPKPSGSKLFDALDKTFAEDARSSLHNGDTDVDTDSDADATKGGDDFLRKRNVGSSRRDRAEHLDTLRAAQEQLQQASQGDSEWTRRCVVC